jgi:dynein heavy chain
MKERLCTNTKVKNKQSKPFFEINLEMEERKKMSLNPSIESVQRAINNAAKEILSCSKKIYNWGQDNLKDEDKEPFYKQIATDKEIVRVILLLTGSIKGTEDSLEDSIGEFTTYENYYKPEPED